MKYDNFEQAEKFVKQIRKEESSLNDLKTAREVQISDGVYTLYAISTREGEYNIQAQELIHFIENDLTMRIVNLKELLEAL